MSEVIIPVPLKTADFWDVVYKKNFFFLDILTLEDRNDTLSSNISNKSI
jgi:hypothetical protein